MDDNQFWIGALKIIGACFCVLAVTVSACTANRHYQTRILIETAKINPIDAKCAIEGETDRTPSCVLRAATK